MTTNRESIQAMLDELKHEIAKVRQQAEQRIRVLQARADTLEEWLAEEVPTQRQLPITGGGSNISPLTAFLKGALADRKARRVDELVRLVEARGGLLDPEVKKPGRAIHGALVGLSKQGYATRRNDGAWEVTK